MSEPATTLPPASAPPADTTSGPGPPARDDHTGLVTLQRRLVSTSGSVPPLEEIWNRYESIINASADCFALISARFTYEAVNNACCRAHGRPREEILGRSLTALWGEETFASVLRPRLRRCFAGEEVHCEERFAFPGSPSRQFHVSLHPHSRHGKITHAIVVTRDITERHRAAEEMRLVLELTRAVQEAPDFHTALAVVVRKICATAGWALGQAWSPTTDNSHLECSPAWHSELPNGREFHAACQEMRFAPGEGLPGRVWASRAPQWIADLAANLHIRRAPLARSLGFSAAMAIPVIVGPQVVAVVEFFVAHPQPEDERMMGVVSAIAAQLGTVFQRKQAEEQLDRFFNRSLDLHCFAGFDGFLKRINPACEKICGFTASELLARPYLELVHPDDRPVVLQELSRIMQGGEVAAFEFRCLRKDGSYIHMSWSATSLPQQRLIIATGRDITERRRAEEAVRHSEEHYRELFHEAYQMQQNLRRLSERVLQVQEQERARLSRELHDEIGQALSAVNIHLSVLKRGLGAGQATLAQRADDALRLLQQTMENVHRFARDLRPAMLDDLGLLPAVRSYVKAFTERTGVLVGLNIEADGRVESLDPEGKTVIYRVVQEGLNNVAKHAQATAVEIALAQTPVHVSLRIQDNGRGFDAGGQTAKKNPERLGLLGLQERVRLVGGEVEIVSRPGEGTALRIKIPFKPV